MVCSALLKLGTSSPSGQWSGLPGWMDAYIEREKYAQTFPDETRKKERKNEFLMSTSLWEANTIVAKNCVAEKLQSGAGEANRSE